MSTPAAKPFRSDSRRLLVHNGMGSLEQRERYGAPEGGGEPPKKALEDDAVPEQAGTRDDSPFPDQMAESALEHPDVEHGDDRRAKEDDTPDVGGVEAQDQSADARRRRAQAAEIDKGYEEKLEGLAQTLQALRREAKPADPEHSIPLPLDRMMLQRFIHQLERGTNRLLGDILTAGVGCAVFAAIAYYFAVGNPFASEPNVAPLRPELRHAMGAASVGDPVFEISQSRSGRGEKLADAGPLSGKAEHRRQLSDSVPTATEHPAEPAPSAQTSSAVSLTSALAPAPASASVEPQTPPARATPMRPSGMDPDEIQLLLKQGQEFEAIGDLATARVVLRRAAEAGAVTAAFALAQCYDPKVLTQMRVRGVAPDIGEARRWYEVARQMGSAEAARHLELLPPE